MTDIPPAELRRRRIDNWRFKTILTAGADRDAALNHLGLFAKYWEAGQVKTRLGRSIGVEAASELYLAFVKHLLQQLADTANYRTLCFWPPSRQMDFQQLLTQLGMGRQRVAQKRTLERGSPGVSGQQYRLGGPAYCPGAEPPRKSRRPSESRKFLPTALAVPSLAR